MSRQLITEYRSELDRIQSASGRFADYKESMIDLLAKVVTVSLETVKITEAMRATERDGNH